MVREQFQGDLKALQQKVIELGELANAALLIAMEGLHTRDVEKALEVIDGDYRMDNLEEEINDLALMLITKQQPVASDLRRIFISIKTATDLERIADHAVNIAKATIRLGEKEVAVSLHNLDEMFAVANEMLHLALEAYEQENLTLRNKLLKWMIPLMKYMEKQFVSLYLRFRNNQKQLRKLHNYHLSRDILSV